MRITFTVATAIAVCIISGCSDADPNRSLVGSWSIPSDDLLAQETIRLWFRKYDDSGTHPTLTYVLRPHGQLQIENGRDRSVGMFGGIETLKGSRSHQLEIAHDDDIQIRRLLARLRPAKLDKDYPFSIPSDCRFITDSGAWNGVSFERAELGGAFVFQNGCEGDGAEKAKLLLRQIISKLPPTERAEDFIE